MNLTPKEIIQYLVELQISDDICNQCSSMLNEQRYEELYMVLRLLRQGFLEDLHESQRRLDHLDYLIYDVKKKK
ncbi:MAG: hypothetical protein Q4E53_06915 [Eubacteriales bacterium]|nr:hypothetical protein [Eubacteriales bacterium]